MTPEQWTKAYEVFSEALDHAPEGRAQLVHELCGGDEFLLSRVLSLLEMHERKATVLDLTDPSRAPGPVDIPQRIGPYRVIRQVGAGGHGAVYEALREDGQFEQRVAIKLLHPTATHAAAVRRFLRERRLLAALEHPNITRLLDGGVTENGLPYFAMEFVEGRNLIDYCAHHQLSIRGRIGIFIEVCNTIDYAHKRLIVHRDLKPANILVDLNGRPRIIDFGIAKLMDTGPSEEDTLTGTVPFSPAYASPEQLRGEPLAISMDVYSLGVLLFELLSGKRPFGGSPASPEESMRRTLFEEPERLSTTAADPAQRKLLEGDLDAICAKALNKDPAFRYGSVGEFARDLQAHLDHVPIAARRSQRLYTLKRTAAKFRWTIAAVLLVVLSLSSGLWAVMTSDSKMRRNYDASRRSLRTLLGYAGRADLPLDVRGALWSSIMEYRHLLDEEADKDANSAAERIDITSTLAGLMGEPFAENLGQHGSAEQFASEAIRYAQEAGQRFPERPDFLEKETRAWFLLGDILTGARKWEGALEAYAHASVLLRTVAGRNPARQDMWGLLTVADSMRGDILLKMGRHEEALRIQQDVLLRRYSIARSQDTPDIRHGIASALLSLGNAQLAHSQIEAALDSFAKAAKGFEEVAPHYRDPSYAWASAVTARIREGDAWLESGDRRKSAAAWNAALEIANRLHLAEPTSALALGNLNEVRKRVGLAPIASRKGSPDPRL